MFVLQTFLVYTDRTGRELPPLSETAMEGREVWLNHNCQSCHQFYGFGGFLGPDLTNASSRLDRARLDEVLTTGVAQMPAFSLSADEITAVAAYLREMDGTGVGQVRAPRPDPTLLASAVRKAVDSGASQSVARGAEQFLRGACTACHAALSPRRIGTYLAPDLSVSAGDLTDQEIAVVLQYGRPANGMPPTGLTDDQRQDMLAFLRWFVSNRRALLDQILSGQADGLPWWEYR